MFSTQADSLCLLALENTDDTSLHLSFEPFEIKKKSLSNLRNGDIFLLSKSLPNIYLLDGTNIVGQAKLGVHMGREALLVEATEHIIQKVYKHKNRAKIWGKFATIQREDLEVGKITPLDFGGHRNIVLYRDEVALALASLHNSTKGYVLQINKVL